MQSVNRLPRYLCTETIDRSTFQPGAAVVLGSCKDLDSRKNQPDWRGRKEQSDRLRLDVAASVQTGCIPGRSFRGSDAWRPRSGSGHVDGRIFLLAPFDLRNRRSQLQIPR
jgi:hypothetical protein